MQQYPLLAQIDSPLDLRKLSPAKLPALCAELRAFAQKEGPGKAAHLRSSLGVTELSVALHYYLDTPRDLLIWDVSHQAYIHKILTGRRDQLAQQRQKGGIAGFTARSESPYDPFGAGHSSTSISALAGFWKADQLRGERRRRVAVIGDGALTGGMAFEALNYLGEQGADCWVILNDNRSSIDPNIGALHQKNSYGPWAEALGFRYHFWPEGHAVEALIESLAGLAGLSGPQFIHLRTEKGRGYQAPQGVEKTQLSEGDFQSAFSASALALLEKHPDLVILSPAMLSGAGLLEAQRRYPARVLDLGIAEQHCVTMAAGLAAAGLRPLVHLYSTFAQRALDQIIHDVALQKLPVIFVLDRAGLVGPDGATHHGAFDLSLLNSIPELRLGAPSGAKALSAILDWALRQSESPVALRYPKDDYPPTHEELWRSYRPHWWQKGQKQALISIGSMAHNAQEAVAQSPFGHLHLPVYKPFPEGDLGEQLHAFERLLVVEESSPAGSVGEHLQAWAARALPGTLVGRRCLPDRFIAHAGRGELLRECGLDSASLRAWLEQA